MRACQIACLSACLILISLSTWAGPHYQGGAIYDHTSNTLGLMIRFNPTVTLPPDNCAGAPAGWMLIPEANKTMIATTLLANATGNRTVTVYTSGYDASGYCAVYQVDPAN